MSCYELHDFTAYIRFTEHIETWLCNYGQQIVNSFLLWLEKQGFIMNVWESYGNLFLQVKKKVEKMIQEIGIDSESFLYRIYCGNEEAVCFSIFFTLMQQSTRK